MNRKLSFDDFVTLYTAYDVYLNKLNTDTESTSKKSNVSPSQAVQPSQNAPSAPAVQPKAEENKENDTAKIMTAIESLNAKITASNLMPNIETKPLSVDDVISKLFD